MEKNDEKQILSGTIKIELPNEGIIISGISVFKKKEYWFFNLPSRGDGTDPDGNAVRYLTFSFLEKEKNNQLIRVLREKVPAFIEQRLIDEENPLIFHQRLKKESRQPETPKAQNGLLEPKETTAIAKPKPIPAIAAKEWRDLPPRSVKPTARYTSKFGR